MAEILETTESKRGVYVKNTSTEEIQYTLAKYNAEEPMIYLEAVNTDNDTAENADDYIIMLNGEEKPFEEFYESFQLRDDKSMSFNDFARESGAIVGTHREVSQIINAMQNAEKFRDELREKAENQYTPIFGGIADAIIDEVNRSGSVGDTLSQRVKEKSEEQEKLLRRSGYYDFIREHASALNTIANSINVEEITKKADSFDSFRELSEEDQYKFLFSSNWIELQEGNIDEDISQFASKTMHAIRHVVGGSYIINDIAQRTEEMATKIRKEEEQRELSKLKKAEEGQAEARTEAEDKAIQNSSPSWISRLPQPLQNVVNWFKDLAKNIANFRKNEEFNSDKSNKPPEPVAMADKGKISDAGRKAEGSQSVSPEPLNKTADQKADTASFNKVDFNYTPPKSSPQEEEDISQVVLTPTPEVRSGGRKLG